MARQSLGQTLSGWWQAWRRNSAQGADSRERKMERDALKLDLSPDDVSTIATKAYYTTNLLPLRMRLLGLDPAAMAQSDPRLLRSLETSCKLCEDKGQCAFDISQNPAHRRWQDYCPNAATLRDLHARKVS